MKPGRFKPHRNQVGRLPPALRCFAPKLDASQQLDLALVHIQYLDAIAKGQGDREALMQWSASVYTWSRAAELLQRGVDEMAPQLQLCTAVLERYRATGRVGFTGPEYQLAKHGVDVMDELARIVDRPTAIAAANWSEQQINRVNDSITEQERAAA